MIFDRITEIDFIRPIFSSRC